MCVVFCLCLFMFFCVFLFVLCFSVFVLCIFVLCCVLGGGSVTEAPMNVEVKGGTVDSRRRVDPQPERHTKQK